MHEGGRLASATARGGGGRASRTEGMRPFREVCASESRREGLLCLEESGRAVWGRGHLVTDLSQNLWKLLVPTRVLFSLLFPEQTEMETPPRPHSMMSSPAFSWAISTWASHPALCAREETEGSRTAPRPPGLLDLGFLSDF